MRSKAAAISALSMSTLFIMPLELKESHGAEANSPVNVSANPSPEDLSPIREAFFVACVCGMQFSTQASLGQTVIDPTTIGATFGVENNPGDLSWFTAGFSLTVGTFILIAGRLGDLYGYKLMFVSAYITLSIASLLAGFAALSKSQVFFDICRALQGLGAALGMPNSVGLFGHYFPNSNKKTAYLALFGAVAPLGFYVGSLFSGIFIQLVWWPWAFWVSGIVYAITSLVLFISIPSKIGNRAPGNLDILGATSGVCGLILVNFAWNQAPVVGWNEPYVYILLIIGFISMGVFVYACKISSYPIVPSLCLRGEVAVVLGCICAGWSCFGIWLYYSFRWAATVDDSSTILAVVMFTPGPIAGLCAAALTVILLKRTSSLVVMLIAMIAFFTGIVLMGTRSPGQIYWGQKFVSLIIQCFGMDMSFPAGILILSDILPRTQQGLAGSLVSTCVNYSISIGLGIAGTVEYYTTKGEDDSLETQIKGYQNAFYMGMGLAGLGVVLGVFSVFKHYMWGSKREGDVENGIKVENENNEANLARGMPV